MINKRLAIKTYHTFGLFLDIALTLVPLPPFNITICIICFFPNKKVSN